MCVDVKDSDVCDTCYYCSDRGGGGGGVGEVEHMLLNVLQLVVDVPDTVHVHVHGY